MSKTLHDYVQRLDQQQRLDIIADFEKFERDGFIDECALRRCAREVQQMYGAGVETITVWMRDLAFEVYRAFAAPVIRDLRQQ